MGSVAVLIPFRGGDPHRDRALVWVLDRLRSLPYEVHVEEVPPGPWCKAVPVWRALHKTTADTVVLHDADVVTDGLRQAVANVEQGYGWAIPHSHVHRLSEDGTAAVLAGAGWRDQPLDQLPYQGLNGGGVVVAKRETLLEVPVDGRFVGWGQEDASHAIALHHLVGPAWRGNALLIHLWHPPQPRLDRKRGSEASWQRFRRYCKARNQPGAMEALVGEARDALTATEPPLHPDPPVHVH